MLIFNMFQTKTSIPWNNEPAPFGSLSAIFGGKIFLGTHKKFFFEGEKIVFLKKKLKKNFGKKFGKNFFLDFFLDFFNITVTYFDSN